MSAAGRAATVVALVAPLVCARAAAQERAQDLAAAGRYAEALAAAQAEPDPLERARGQTVARHFAGDLRGALREGLLGLEQAPADVALLNQAATLAVNLYEAELAAELVPRFAAAARAPGLAPDLAAFYAARARRLEDDARGLLAAAEARRVALRRARWSVAAALAASALLAGLLGWSTRPRA